MSRLVKIYKLLLVYFVLCVFFIGNYEFTYSTNKGYRYDSYKQIMNEYSVTRY